MSWEQETTEYYNWLMRIEMANLEKELLEIISYFSENCSWFFFQVFSCIHFSPVVHLCLKYKNFLTQGFTQVLFTQDEAAQIISHCEEWLLAAGTIKDCFTAAKIQGKILKDYLILDDYLAPQKVIKQLSLFLASF